MEISDELTSNKTILLLMPSAEYNTEIVRVVKSLSKESVCYVTLNKTADSLKEMFKKNKVNTENIVFIDAISKTIKKAPNESDSIYFVSSPGALTELSIVISKFLRHEFSYLIFDSLTSLMVYTKKAPVAKFLSSLINKIKESKTKAVFYSLSMKEHSELVNECSMFVDKVIDVGKVK